MPNHPLAEVFGYPIDNMTAEADRHRKNRLCRFGNSVPNCTKTSIENPLGVCSVFGAGGETVITCPVRFQEGWRIASDAAAFFFPDGALWTSLTEVRLKDSSGKSAGNIDVVLLSYDALGRILDYGSLEIQAVYISDNRYDTNGRKLIAPQLTLKRDIPISWNRKTAVAINKAHFNALSELQQVPHYEADIVWLVYRLKLDGMQNCYILELENMVYTKFAPAWQDDMMHELEEGTFLDLLHTHIEKGIVE